MTSLALLSMVLALATQAPTSTGIIAGRALDSTGKPIVGVQVQLLQYRYRSHATLGAFSDHPELWGADGSGGQTNDRGEFRFIDVPPGKYYLRVPSAVPQRGGLAELSPLGAQFYPGVEGLTKAQQIEIRAGQEVLLNDVVLARTSLQPIRLRGTGALYPSLRGGPAPDEPPASLGLVDGVPAVRPDEPGNYTVCAITGAPRGYGCADVVYTGAALDVALTMVGQTGTFTGRVLLDDQPFSGVMLGAIGTAPGSNFGATSAANGLFSQSPVYEGPAKLRAIAVRDGFYVASIRQGQRDALTEGFLVSKEDTNLEVRVVKSSSTVQGRVLGGSATVVLIPQGPLALRTDKESTHRITTTNLDDTFEIRYVIPGTYRAYAVETIQPGSHLDASVFKPFEAQSALVEIAQNGSVSLDLRTNTLDGIIAGRALDSAGNPIVGMQVQLFQYRHASHALRGAGSDRAELWHVGDVGGYRSRPEGGRTNDRGEYRFIDVPPGRYLLRVPSPTPLNLSPGQTAPLSPLAAAFYPGGAGITKAEQIEVRAGEELRLRDLVLTPTPLQPIRVRSTVPGAQPVLFGGPVPEGPPFTLGLLDGVRVLRPDEPGSYTVCAAVNRSPCKDIVYTGAALDVELTPTAPRTYFTGRVLMEQRDGSPPVPFEGFNVAAVRLEPDSSFGATSATDGTFKSTYPVREGLAKLRFLSQPVGYYVSSVRQGSRDALTEDLLISDQDTNLEVRLVQSANVVRGRVTGGNRAVVVLIPQGPLARRHDTDNTHRIAATDLSGNFEIPNVIPGTYRAFAFATLEEGSHLDASVFAPFEAQSTVVEVARDGTVSIEVRRIP